MHSKVITKTLSKDNLSTTRNKNLVHPSIGVMNNKLKAQTISTKKPLAHRKGSSSINHHYSSELNMTHQLARDSLKATLAPVNETNYSELFAERSMKMFKKASVETPSLRNI